MKKLQKLNSRGIAHILAPALVVVGAGIIGTYMLVASHADPLSTAATSKVYTYPAGKMYGDGRGPSSTVTDGGVVVQEIAVGSIASIVNNVSLASQTKSFDAWEAANLGKSAKFCVTVKSVGASSVLWAGVNTANHFIQTTVAKSSSYQKFCSVAQPISNSSRPPGSHVTFTLSMSNGNGTVKPTSGPLRIKSFTYELQ